MEFEIGDGDKREEDEEEQRQKNARTRRKSRIGRQHSYDEEVKVRILTDVPMLYFGKSEPCASLYLISDFSQFSFEKRASLPLTFRATTDLTILRGSEKKAWGLIPESSYSRELLNL